MERQNEIGFIHIENLNILNDVPVRNSLNCSEKLINKKNPNTRFVWEGAEQFSLKIHNKFPSLGDETDDLEETNERLTEIIMEATIEKGEKAQGN